jgi:hypothetical protein
MQVGLYEGTASRSEAGEGLAPDFGNVHAAERTIVQIIR